LRVSKEDFFEGEHSDPRNHIIQEIFRHLNLCERADSGIPKILKAVKDYSYKHPDIEEDKDKFTFKFWNIEKIEDGKKQIESLENQNKIEKDLLKSFSFMFRVIVIVVFILYHIDDIH